MRKVILANPKSINPAKIIRDQILENTGKRFPVFTSNQYVNRDDIILLRYANSLEVNVQDTNYNSKEFIRLCGNKLSTSQFLIEHEVLTVEFNRGIPDYFPVVLRKTMYGQGGNGIVVCKNIEEFNREGGNNYYWSYYYPFSSEYRAHVLGNNIARIFKKVLRNGEREDEFPIRNLTKYDFSLRSDINAFPKLTAIVNKISEILPGKFYALDIGINNGDPVIIEINSGPGLSENTAEFYTSYLISELNI